MVIAHNMLAMNAQRQYNVVTTDRRKTTEKLSSGYKINRAADDAAGLTISEKMRSQIRGLNQGSDNIQDGVSLVQIADGALAEVNDMLHRMTELSIKSANGTNTDADRQAIQEEINQLISEIDRISQSTEYNTMPLFDKPKDQDGDSSSITKLVTSPGGETKSFSEAYSPTGAAPYYPAATLDFSNIKASNINQLEDGYFSFKCIRGCGEIFKFEFFNNPGEPNSVTGQLNSNNHVYKINLDGITNGTDLVNSLIDTVKNNMPSASSVPYGLNSFGDAIVSHAQAMGVDGNKIIIYDYKYAESTEKSAMSLGDRYKGYIDASSIIKPVVEEYENHFFIQCSNNKDDFIPLKTERMNSAILKINGLDVSSEMSAKNSIQKISDAGDRINKMRSDLGAFQNRLEHAYDNNNNKAENTTAAESRIRDTDMAKEMVKLSMQNILTQAGEAMMAQANQSTQSVLSLLQ